uniref:Uncharacterized protein n=1 Tax=viral metagenome TaxID=1070528 RepID=A0A6C0IGH8_9ZZZZ
MTNYYLIPFWTVFSVVLAVIGLLIWLGMVKSRDNQRIEMGAIGVQWMMEQYVDRALQKTVYHLLRYDKLEAKKGMDLRLLVAREQCVQTDSPLLTKNLFSFPRGREVVETLRRELSEKKRCEETNLFLLPDVLVHQSGNTWYAHLLKHAGRVVANDSSAWDQYTNDEAKQHLGALVQQTTTMVPISYDHDRDDNDNDNKNDNDKNDKNNNHAKIETPTPS